MKAKQKQKTYNYEFQASETVYYDVSIEASSLEEAQEKLHQMDSGELNECAVNSQNWNDELYYTDDPEETEEEE